MIFCTQFSELHFVQVANYLPHLRYLDIHSSTLISFDTALTIIVGLSSIMSINFDPKNAKLDVEYWKEMLRTFSNIHFGHNVRVSMPYYGNMLCIPQSNDLEDN